MDAPNTYPLVLPHGLNVEGKLVFPDGYQLEVHTPFVFVQGELNITSTRSTSASEDVQIVLTGNEEATLFPNAQNSVHCGTSGCNFGSKPVVVAGGKLRIQGLPDSCPTWTKLKNVVSATPAPIDLPSYVEPAPGCSDVLVETHFNSGLRDGWYRNYAGIDQEERIDSHTPQDSYWLFGGRTDTRNGPQINLDHLCVVPNVAYFVSAKARLTKPGGISNCQLYGTNCLKLTSFIQDSGHAGEARKNRGTAGQQMDGEWFDFVFTTAFDEQFGDNEIAQALHLYWEGPEAGVEIALDDIR